LSQPARTDAEDCGGAFEKRRERRRRRRRRRKNGRSKTDILQILGTPLTDRKSNTGTLIQMQRYPKNIGE
jgi:hypothetical protein